MEEIKCYGCGAVIQSEDEKKIGYVPKNALNKDKILCKRCFQLKNYHQLQEASLTDDDFLNILNRIGEQNCLVIYMVDLFDFNGSLIQGLMRHINYNDLIVVGNKRDVLPKSIKDHKIIMWLNRQLKKEGIKPLDVLLTSGKKNYHLDELMTMIDKYRHGRDVYVVGVTNVGKSSMINALLKAYSDGDTFITTSEFPGTTLDMIEIPLDEQSSIIDTPGIINRHQMAHLLNHEDLKTVLPQSELRPVNYQLQDQKMSHADDLYNRHLTLHPEIAGMNSIQDFKVYEWTLPDYKVDIVISGLGFITVKKTKARIRIMIPSQVGVFIRDALI